MPRITKPLSDTEIKASKPKKKTYRLFDGGGLYLQITTKGQKYWRLKYRIEGKDKTIALGVYPQLSLLNARKNRQEFKEKIISGIDPLVERKHKKEVEKTEIAKIVNTFKKVSEEYFVHIGKTKGHSEGYHSLQVARMNNHAYPYFGDKSVVDITKSDVREVISILVDKRKKETASRVLHLIKDILDYAEDREYIEFNVSLGIKASKEIGKSEVVHYPVITEDKPLKSLLLALDNYSGEFITKQALRIMPYVALRPYNIRFAEWSEIDLKKNIWTIKAEKMKMKETFRLPLPDVVIKILKETKKVTGDGKFVFPSSVHKDHHMSENTLNMALRRLGYKKGEIVSHSFRGIMSTIAHSKMSEHGFDSLVIEKALAHVDPNKVRASYAHSDLFDERVKLMKWWEKYLEEVKK